MLIVQYLSKLSGRLEILKESCPLQRLINMEASGGSTNTTNVALSLISKYY